MNPTEIVKCACGCGRVTPVAKKSNKRRGIVKGQRAKWLYGHQHRVYRDNGWNAHEPAWYRARRQA
jgi:hypothetical protein